MPVDYSKIARVYDANPIRHRIPVDDVLSEQLRTLSGTRSSVLDVACGSGNYLVVQREAFANRDVDWYGLDASPDMLALARAKLPHIDLRLGRVEAMPYESGRFPFVANNFAFHLFEDKQRALDEMVRVLAPGGVLRIRNIDPYAMPRWWAYDVWPHGFHEDQKRFWPASLLGFELERRGFDVRLRIEYESAPIPLAAAYADAVRRDASTLTLVPDDEFARGVEQLRQRLEREPGARIHDESAVATWIATRAV